jgi:hypothetical protein
MYTLKIQFCSQVGPRRGVWRLQEGSERTGDEHWCGGDVGGGTGLGDAHSAGSVTASGRRASSTSTTGTTSACGRSSDRFSDSARRASLGSGLAGFSSVSGLGSSGASSTLWNASQSLRSHCRQRLTQLTSTSWLAGDGRDGGRTVLAGDSRDHSRLGWRSAASTTSASSCDTN